MSCMRPLRCTRSEALSEQGCSCASEWCEHIISLQIIFAKLSTWRAAAAAGSIAPPKLVGSDWRVDVKASTAGVKRTGEPTLLLNLKVQANASAVGEMPPADTVTAELSQAALSTLLGGLQQVRDQLAAAAQ